MDVNDLLQEASWKVDQPTRDIACPNCGGGSSQEHAFALKVKEDAIVWHCHRATCGFTGGVNIYGGRDGALPPEAIVSSSGGSSSSDSSSSNGAVSAVQGKRQKNQQMKLSLHLLEKKQQQVRARWNIWTTPGPK